MLKRREDLSNIIVAIDDLAKHPPETPMERLRAALLIAEANEILADAADGEERLRRRTTLPDGYHLLHRKPKRAADPDAQLWSVLRGETEICTHRYREKACEMAWTHHDEPELFEGFEGDSATVRAAKRLQRRDELLAVEHPLPPLDVVGPPGNHGAR